MPQDVTEEFKRYFNAWLEYNVFIGELPVEDLDERYDIK